MTRSEQLRIVVLILSLVIILYLYPFYFTLCGLFKKASRKKLWFLCFLFYHFLFPCVSQLKRVIIKHSPVLVTTVLEIRSFVHYSKVNYLKWSEQGGMYLLTTGCFDQIYKYVPFSVALTKHQVFEHKT